MKIPSDALIPEEKLTKYLLVHKEVDDKSKLLAQAGFSDKNPNDLESAIHALTQTYDAIMDRENVYGTFYTVSGELLGSENRTLSVTTVRIQEKKSGSFRFITLKPWRKRSDET